MNSDSEDKDKTIELFPTDEFVKVCEELGLLEPTITEIKEEMWKCVPEYGEQRWQFMDSSYVKRVNGYIFKLADKNFKDPVDLILYFEE